MKRPEQALHLAVARYLSIALHPPTFWTSIEHATKLGPVAAAMRKARGVKAGLPDILVMYAGDMWTGVIGIELKAAKGKQSAAQVWMQDVFRQCNADYCVCYSVGDVEKELSDLGIPLHAKLS